MQSFYKNLRAILPIFPKCDNADFEHNKTPATSSDPSKSSIFQMISFGTNTDIALIIASLILALIGGIIQPVVLLIGGRITDLYLSNGTRVGNDQFLVDVVSLIYIGLATGLIIFILATFQEIFIQRATRNIISKLRRDYLTAVLRQDDHFMIHNPSGIITSQLNENTEIISDGLGNKLCILVRAFAMFFSSTIACSFINWQLTFTTFTMGPLSALVLHFLTKANESTNEDLLRLSSKAGGIIEESIMNIRTVQACNGQSFMIKKLREVHTSFKILYTKMAFWIGFFEGFSLFVVYVITGIALLIGCRLFFNGGIKNAGDVILIVNTICVTGYLLGLLGPHFSSLNDAARSFQTLFRLIEKTSINIAKNGSSMKNTKGHIVFNNVHFKYPSRDEEVLKGLSFEALPGQTIALVGASGCGKSTSIGLLAKLYRATEGEILIDGRNIDFLDTRSLRQNIGIVQQEPKLFQGSIIDNIRLGRDVSYERIMRACEISNSRNFIDNLEEGIETQIGAGRAQLSGGETQRICISRALVTEPPILILDEATSALDSNNEIIVNNSLLNPSNRRTTIVITHRLSNLRHVDKIYVIDDGGVKESGTHSDLLAANGLYAKLASSQDINGSSSIDSVQTSTKIPNNTAEGGSNPGMCSESSDGISWSGIRELSKYIPENLRLLGVIIILAIPRSLELCTYGLGLSFAFNTLQQSKNEYMSWALTTLCEQCVAGIGVWIVHSLIMYVSGKVASNVMCDLKESVLRELLHKPISYYDAEKTSTSASVSKLISHSHNCYACLDHRAIRFILFLLGTIFSLLLAFPFVWELGLLGFAITILLTVFTFRFVSLAQNAHKAKSENDTSGEFGIAMVEQLRTIKLMALEPYFESEFEQRIAAADIYENRIAFVSAINFAITQSYVFLCDMILFYVGALLIYHGKYTTDRIFLAFNGAQMSAWGVMYFSPWIPEIVKGSSSANQLFSFFDSPSLHNGVKTPKLKGRVNLEKVSFSYPSTPKIEICRELSLTANAGESIGVVGASGSGKSTILAMLERFYTQKSGLIQLDEMDLNEIDVKHLRENIALVGQQPILFNATILENITIGMDSVTIEEVKRICDLVNASNFIENFPLGYDTMVGEGGNGLSGGQKQRIAIARALIRNPQIILLDEATSALDAQSERIVQNSLRSATAGRTTITIAHRLSTIRECDRIYYISNGSVAECGTHSELLNINGMYARLVASQIS